MHKCVKNWLLRGVSALAGILLAVLAVCSPVTFSEYVEYNDGRLKLPAMGPGDVLEQPLTIDHETDQLSVRADVVKEAKELTMTITLLRDGKAVVSEDFPLRKVKPKGRLILDLPGVQAAGSYVLRLEAAGEGSVTLGGDAALPAQLNAEDIPAQLDGEDQATGCYVRRTSVKRQYSNPAVFSGFLLMLMAFVPGGGKEGKRRG